MRDYALALRAPAFGWLLLGAAAAVCAQGALDLRLPSSARSTNCGMCGEIRSIK